MPDWNSRLVVMAAGKTVTPISSFTTTFATGTTPIHSIEADNVGVIQKPKTCIFTMTLPAIGSDQTFENAAALYKLAIAGTAFDVALQVQSGNDWSFKSLMFRNCYITSANPSVIGVGTTGLLDTTPIATFSGMVKDFTADTDVVAA
jgi:hypothetical protein